VPSTGLTCTLTPSSITGSGTSLLSCQGSLGTYTVTITGTSSPLVHAIAVSFVVGITHSVTIDSVSISPQGSVAVGTLVTFTVQVDNKGSTAETVVVNVLANNITVATASNVAVPANTVKPVTLTWTTTAAGTFKMSANVILPAGETNTLSNSSSVGNYTVQPASTSPLSDPTTQLALVGVMITAAAIGGFILIRRRNKSPATV
jgi:hypothetical protein